MASIINVFNQAYKDMRRKRWDKFYLLLDIHGTIFKPSYYNKEMFEYYPYAKKALRLLSKMKYVSIILWSSTYDENIEKYVKKLLSDGITVDYVNENPEVKNTDLQCFDKKLYFNVGLDDRFGFNPKIDWFNVFFWYKIRKIKEWFANLAIG